MPLHFQLRREEEFGAINGLKGNPLATRSLVTVLPRVKLAQSPSPYRLRTVADARDYILALPEDRKSQHHWQHTAKMILDQADVAM